MDNGKWKIAVSLRDDCSVCGREVSEGAKLLPRIKKGVDEVHTYRGRLRITEALVSKGGAPALHMNRAKLVPYRAGPQRREIGAMRGGY